MPGRVEYFESISDTLVTSYRIDQHNPEYRFALNSDYPRFIRKLLTLPLFVEVSVINRLEGVRVTSTSKFELPSIPICLLHRELIESGGIIIENCFLESGEEVEYVVPQNGDWIRIVGE